MARVVSPDRVLSAPVSILSNFYRQEFMRHRECLAQQREFWRHGEAGEGIHRYTLSESLENKNKA